MNLLKKLVLSSALLAAAALPAAAQTVNANNLVSVNVSNVANEIAKNLSVDVQDVVDLGSVQAPIGVAATVCNVQANVLAGDNKSDGAACDAQNTSQALNQIVQRQLNSQ